MNLSSFSSSFSQLPIDWILLAAFAALVAVDALRSGSRRAVSIALSAPLALMLFEQLQNAALFGSIIKALSSALIQVGIFAALFVLLFILISRMNMVGFSSGAFPVSAIIAGVATAVVVIIVWLQVVPLSAVWSFGPTVHSIFAEAHRFWWLVVAYGALAFASM